MIELLIVEVCQVVKTFNLQFVYDGLKMSYSESEGRFLVKLARRAVEEYLNSGSIIKPPKETPPKLMEKRGVFTTINLLIEDEKGEIQRVLRGCIGYPLPIKPLAVATIETAISAASEDPRFPPLQPEELDLAIFEVSILTVPRLLEVRSPKEYLERVKIGRDGLIVERYHYSGLLLPQVPVEYNWDVEEYLANACMKAGLPPDAWLMKGTRIYTFQAEIFSEIEPNGEVIKLSLDKWRPQH